MAGGTGGHVFPALAVAHHLRAQGFGVSWLGTRHGLESEVVPKADFPIDYISVHGLRGKGVFGWLMAPFTLMVALIQALGVCKQRRPNAVLGMGGFVTGPGGLAAWLLRLPLVIHEQNAIPGLTNRLLARFATQVLEAFPGSFPNAVQAIHTGNPVREDIARLPAPDERFNTRQGPIRLLIFGGSLGAQILNQLLPQVLSRLLAKHPLDIWHQSGQRNLQETQSGYAQAKITARVEPFIEDMAQAYAWADLVICRAGALTVSELAAAGVGAILVPFPHAVDDHQTRNAAYLSNAKAAITLQQVECTPERLQAQLQELITAGREHLLSMAQAARRLAMPEATVQVTQACLRCAHG